MRNTVKTEDGVAAPQPAAETNKTETDNAVAAPKSADETVPPLPPAGTDKSETRKTAAAAETANDTATAKTADDIYSLGEAPYLYTKTQEKEMDRLLEKALENTPLSGNGENKLDALGFDKLFRKLQNRSTDVEYRNPRLWSYGEGYDRSYNETYATKDRFKSAMRRIARCTETDCSDFTLEKIFANIDKKDASKITKKEFKAWLVKVYAGKLVKELRQNATNAKLRSLFREKVDKVRFTGKLRGGQLEGGILKCTKALTQKTFPHGVLGTIFDRIDKNAASITRKEYDNWLEKVSAESMCAKDIMDRKTDRKCLPEVQLEICHYFERSLAPEYLFERIPRSQLIEGYGDLGCVWLANYFYNEFPEQARKRRLLESTVTKVVFFDHKNKKGFMFTRSTVDGRISKRPFAYKVTDKDLIVVGKFLDEEFMDKAVGDKIKRAYRCVYDYVTAQRQHAEVEAKTASKTDTSETDKAAAAPKSVDKTVPALPPAAETAK